MKRSEIEIIKKLYIDLCSASESKDVDTLKEILADDYILVHMTGKKQTKNEYINSVVSEELKYYESIHDSIEVKIDGDVAKVIGKTRTLASPFGMNKMWWRLKQDMTLIKREGKWYIIQSIASMY